jgi:type III secretion system FlhB-like substrate exporter
MTDKVVGLSVDLEASTAPTVLLKGAGHEAAAIVQAGVREDVPVIRDAALLNALYRVPIDAPVGRELFPVMAALIAHVLQIDSSQRGGMGR